MRGVMTSHGFGGVKVSSIKPTAAQVAEIAKRISEVKPIRKVHVVWAQRQCHDIIFEFDHLVSHHMKCEDLLGKLKKIEVDGHGIGDPADFWIIQSTYANGKLIEAHSETR